MVSLISLFSFKWMQHSSLTASTVVLHCCMGLNICPFQPQKWLCSSGGWFLSIQGSSEAWKSLSIRHDILSTAADPLGSLLPTSARPESSILACPCTAHRAEGPQFLPAAEQGVGPHHLTRNLPIPCRKRLWSQPVAEEREELSPAPSGGLCCWDHSPGIFLHSGCSSPIQQLCCSRGVAGDGAGRAADLAGAQCTTLKVWMLKQSPGEEQGAYLTQVSQPSVFFPAALFP